MSIPLTKKIKIDWAEDAYGDLQQGQRFRGTFGCRCFKREIQREESENKCAISLVRTSKGLEFNCFKPSCELGGGIVGCGDSWDRPRGDILCANRDGRGDSLPTDVVPALPQGIVKGLSGFRRDWLASFGLTSVDIARYGIAEHPTDTCGIYFPQFDTSGRSVGYLRRYVAGQDDKNTGGHGDTKWMSHLLPGTVPFSRPLHASTTVFIVEDVVSLIRVGKTANTLAALSTAFGSEQIPNVISMLRRAKATRVLIALDADAWHKAKKMESLLTCYWGGVKAIRTSQDPKSWSDEQLERYINE